MSVLIVFTILICAIIGIFGAKLAWRGIKDACQDSNEQFVERFDEWWEDPCPSCQFEADPQCCLCGGSGKIKIRGN